MVFKFSFLLSIPAIIGDLAVEVYLQQGTLAQGVGVSAIDLIVALAVTVVAGYLAIVLVKKLVLTKRFYYFAAYSFSLGVILIALALLGI
jgi:undecaprenyl pyrophosphate phosphatase UppP